MSIPLFIFAATICRILLDYQWVPEDSLSEILLHQTDTSKLNGTYLPVLDRLLVGQDGKKREQLITEYRTVLGTIILLENPLSVSALATLLGVRKASLCIRLDSLHSIIDIPHDELTPIRLFHLSLRDFLLNANTRESTPLWVDEKEINQKLTACCLNIMRKMLKKNICNLPSYGIERLTIDSQSISDYLPPELQYSCRYWIYHLARGKDPMSQIDDITAFLDVHLLHWIEVMSILGLVSEVLGCINTLESAIQLRIIESKGFWNI
ncbi:WD domain-containing protein [Aspergillus carlsbadensis]|nr:WD domain-containing protein [Aspergillus carlsbadensis]